METIKDIMNKNDSRRNPVASTDGRLDRLQEGFILSRKLKENLKKLSLSVNGSGAKIVTWTDMLELGVSKLTAGELEELRKKKSVNAQYREIKL